MSGGGPAQLAAAPAAAPDAGSGWNPKPLVLAGLTLVAYIAAVNRTQAFPWALAALLAATLAVGLVWPRWLVARMAVTRTGPERGVEGETLGFAVVIENRGWLPRFMIEVTDRLPFAGAAAGAPRPGETVLGGVVHIGGGAVRRIEVPLQCEKRGCYRLGPVGLASSFPLGLVEARQRAEGSMRTLTIYPAVFPIASLPLAGTPSEINRGGFLLPEGAGAAEFCGLREYRRGDSPRHVHWPTTARLNELMVKEFEPLASACLYLVVDQSVAANVGAGKHASFEYAVRIAASIARYATLAGLPIRLSGEGSRPLSVGYGQGETHYRAILDALAVVEADGAVPYAQALETVAANCRHGQTVVVFLSEPADRMVPTLGTLALLRARGAHVLAVVFDRASFDASIGVAASPSPPLAGSLADLGVAYLAVRRGDDLVRVFNP